MSVVITLVLMLVLLLLKGFFSGSEAAVVSTDWVKLRHKAGNGDRGAQLALTQMERPERLLTTTLIGTNISTIALTTIGTLLLVGLLGDRGELAALLIFTPLLLVLGEIVPKSIYRQKADVLTPYIVFPLRWMQTVLAPLVFIFSRLGRLAATLLGGKGKDAAAAMRDQFSAVVSMTEQSDTIEAFSRGQVRRVLRFGQMTAAEAMWPLTEGRSLERSASLDELVSLRRETGQRLIPLYDGAPSNIVAIARIESWDLMDPVLREKSARDFIHPVRYAPYLQSVREILEILHEEPEATLVVVDEFGGALGLIALDGLVRRTLGVETSPLTGRHDPAHQPVVERQDDGTYLLDARLPIVKVNESLDISLSTLAQSTIGGYALAQFRRLPEVGETFTAEGYTFAVAETDGRSIVTLRAGLSSTSTAGRP